MEKQRVLDSRPRVLNCMIPKLGFDTQFSYMECEMTIPDLHKGFLHYHGLALGAPSAIYGQHSTLYVPVPSS